MESVNTSHGGPFERLVVPGDSIAYGMCAGQAIFQQIAVHCSEIGAKTLRSIAEREITIANTGGTDTDVEI